MPDDIAGKFIKVIYEYQTTGVIPEMDFALEMAVTPFINQFIRDGERYENVCERNKNNGLKGGRPKQTQPNPKNPVGYSETQTNPTEPKKPYNNNKNDSDSKNVNKNDNKKVNNLIIVKSDLEKTFDDYLEMRKKIKKPATAKAIDLVKAKIRKLSQGDEQLAIQLIEQSILNGWQDIYELKVDFKKQNQQAQKNQMHEAFKSATIKMREQAAEKWGVNQ